MGTQRGYQSGNTLAFFPKEPRLLIVHFVFVAMEDDDKVLFHSFLRYYDLDPYYERFVKMGVLKVSHLKDVSDADLKAIGLSGPERTRLRKKAEKNFSTSGKLKVNLQSNY